MKYTDILELHKAAGMPAITIELTLPRQRDGIILDFDLAVERAANVADMISLTDCPGAKFDCTNILPAYEIKTRLKKNVMFHVTCRDANRRRIMGDVITAAQHGLENILVIRGDLPKQEQRHLSATVHDYKHSWEIIRDISNINNGIYFGDRQGARYDICVGCAVNPTIQNLEVEIANENRLAGKAKAGAQFAVTQIFFDAQQYLKCRDMMQAHGINIPLVAGILVLESEGMINFIEKELSGIAVPSSTKDIFRNKSVERCKELGVGAAKQIVDELRKIAPGFHIYNGSSKAALELAEYIRYRAAQ